MFKFSYNLILYYPATVAIIATQSEFTYLRDQSNNEMLSPTSFKSHIVLDTYTPYMIICYIC